VYLSELTGLRTKAAVRAFARELAIHPGIVGGRLQHERLIDPSWMNELKQRFQFKAN
jgi:HTH-type transcriptional regulator/antitoxin HigA